MMRGYLDGSADGISFYEVEQGFGGGNTKALRLTTSGTESGAGLLQMSEFGQNVSYSFAYNSNHFLRHVRSAASSSFRSPG